MHGFIDDPERAGGDLFGRFGQAPVLEALGCAADAVEWSAELAPGPAEHGRLGGGEHAGGDHRADGGSAGLAVAADDLRHDQLHEVRAGRPNHADDRISGGAGNHRVGFPQPELGECHQQPEWDRRHAKREEHQGREIEQRVAERRVVGDGGDHQEGDEEQHEPSREAERRPFDLLPLDPARQPSIAGHLPAEHGQQRDQGDDHLQRGVDLGQAGEDYQRDGGIDDPAHDPGHEHAVGEQGKRDQQEVEPRAGKQVFHPARARPQPELHRRIDRCRHQHENQREQHGDRVFRAAKREQGTAEQQHRAGQQREAQPSGDAQVAGVGVGRRQLGGMADANGTELAALGRLEEEGHGRAWRLLQPVRNVCDEGVGGDRPIIDGEDAELPAAAAAVCCRLADQHGRVVLDLGA